MSGQTGREQKTRAKIRISKKTGWEPEKRRTNRIKRN